MIPNLLNVLIGIAIAAWAVLTIDDEATQLWSPLASGVAIFLLALWARQSDVQRWQSSTNMVHGVVMLGVVIMTWGGMFSPIATFWGVFWIGMIVAILALWAVLYRGPADDALADELG